MLGKLVSVWAKVTRVSDVAHGPLVYVSWKGVVAALFPEESRGISQVTLTERQ